MIHETIIMIIQGWITRTMNSGLSWLRANLLLSISALSQPFSSLFRNKAKNNGILNFGAAVCIKSPSIITFFFFTQRKLIRKHARHCAVREQRRIVKREEDRFLRLISLAKLPWTYKRKLIPLTWRIWKTSCVFFYNHSCFVAAICKDWRNSFPGRGRG